MDRSCVTLCFYFLNQRNMNVRLIRVLIDIGIATLIVSVAVIVFAIMSRPPKKIRCQTIAYDEYIPTANTGDIIVFSNVMPQIRWSLQDPWTHIGMVIRYPGE